jgi:predicted MFS family arabinose efflux permease
MVTMPSALGSSPKIMFIVVLLIAVFAAAVIDIVIPITILDIAQTFAVLPGTVAQLDSIISIASVATALLLAGFGSRFRYKSLVIMGILFIAFCAMGLFLAPTFPIVQLIVPLNGIGSVMIVVTAQTFIGNSYSLDRKAKAIGWVAAAGTIANAIGSPIIGFITGIGSWRSVFIWFILPASVVSLILVFVILPYNLPEPLLKTKKEPLIRGIKHVLTNKSAVACLVSAFLSSAFVFGSMIFEVTFLRQIFSVSPGFASLIGPLVGIAIITVGAIIGGHVVNRVGRKLLTVLALFSAGLLLMLSYFMQDLGTFLTLRWIASLFIGISIASASNLMLEQAPSFRGTAMSLNSAFRGVGTAVGISVVGTVFNLFVNPTIGFQALGLTIGFFAFAGAIVTLFFTRDPLNPIVSKPNS